MSASQPQSNTEPIQAREETQAAQEPQEQAAQPETNLYEAQIAELKDQLMRALADAENTRRRARMDVEEATKYAVAKFARDIVGVAENLDRATKSIPEEARRENETLRSLGEGVDMTLRQLLDALEKNQIRRIYPLGERFDHNLHQAVAQIDDPSHPPGTVVQVIQAGYTLHDRLLLPAMVGVAAAGASSPQHHVDTQA